MRVIPEPTDFSSYNLALVFRRRQTLFSRLRRELNKKLIGEEWQQLLFDLRKLLKDKVPRETLERSIPELFGVLLGEPALRAAAFRLAANLKSLFAAQPVPPWTGQTKLEWVPIEVMDSELHKRRDGNIVTRFRLRVLAGTPAGEYLSKQWSNRAVYFFASRLGFSKKPEMKMRNYRELVRCRFYVQLDPEKSARGLGFEHLYPSSACLRWNKELIQQRHRITFTCPAGFTHDCYQCGVGYDQCQAATHSRTFKKSICSKCGRMHWINPSVSETVCIACTVHSY